MRQRCRLIVRYGAMICQWAGQRNLSVERHKPLCGRIKKGGRAPFLVRSFHILELSNLHPRSVPRGHCYWERYLASTTWPRRACLGSGPDHRCGVHAKACQVARNDPEVTGEDSLFCHHYPPSSLICISPHVMFAATAQGYVRYGGMICQWARQRNRTVAGHKPSC